MGYHFTRSIGSVCTKEMQAIVVNARKRPRLTPQLPRSPAAKVKKYLTASVPDSEESEGEDGDKCMVCGEREEDDVDVEDWVACESCSGWIHSKCIPPDHPYLIADADFYCHVCLNS